MNNTESLAYCKREAKKVARKTVNIMTKFTTQLLTDETKAKVESMENVIEFANREEAIYLNAMTNAGVDFERRDSLVKSFNESVCSFAYHYGK